MSQGIAIASGLQSNFDWVGLAASGAAAAGGAAISQGLASQNGFLGVHAGAGSFGNLAISSGASLLANAATRSALDGSGFGENILIGVPDVVAALFMKVLTSEVLQTPQEEVSHRPPTAAVRVASLGTDGDPHGISGVDLPPPLPQGEVVEWNGPISADKARSAQALWRAVINDPNYSEVAPEWIKYWEMKEISALESNGYSNSVSNDGIEYFEAERGKFYEIASELYSGSLSIGSDSISGIQEFGDWISGEIIGSIDSKVRQYNYLRDVIEKSVGKDPAGYIIRGELYAWDFVVGATSTVAKGLGSLPSAVVHPFTSFVEGPAKLIDWALTAENTPATQQVRRAYANVSSMSGHEIATGLGNITGEGILLLGPSKFKGPLRFEARAYEIAAESQVTAGVRAVHKNSLDYVGDTHVYAIRNPDGTLYKVGESAQGVRVSDGASIRAEQQARALQRETGDFYTTEIRRNFGGKAEARAYETRFIETYIKLYGKRPPGNPINR